MTKIDRRNFLRAMPAAPLAAPSIARDMARDMARAKRLPSLGGAGSFYPAGAMNGAMNVLPEVDAEWLARRRAELESGSRGEMSADEEESMRRSLFDGAAHHYDSLRSVSQIMRARLHADHMIQRELHERKRYFTRDLEQFLKSYGLA